MQDVSCMEVNSQFTVFVPVLAVATINFNLKVAFLNLRAIPLADIDMVDSFFRTDFRIFKIYDQVIAVELSQGRFLPRTDDHSWLTIVATPIKLCSCVHVAIVQGWLLFSFVELHVRGGYILIRVQLLF